MFTNQNKRIPLLQYWTARYLVTLFIGIIIIGILSTVWIRHNAAQKRLDSVKSFAEEIAEAAVDQNGFLLIDVRLARDIERRQKYLGLGQDLTLLVVNNEGTVLYSRLGITTPQILQNFTIPADQEQTVQRINANSELPLYIVKQSIRSNNNNVIGSVYMLYPVNNLARNPEEIQFLILMLGGIALLGWIIIYTLTRKLAQPIKNVADAAKQIVSGNYELDLDTNVREQEIYDLIESFKDMAERLQQLEALRTVLLAGVTHELKTPVTSISGLIQAIKDGVVEGEEAQDFLDICLSETARLQKMVEDLLDFNAFVAGDIRVEMEKYNINKLVQEITYQWLIAQEDDSISIKTVLLNQDINTATDAMRLQQILYNLLNNAKQASAANGKIEVILNEQDHGISIDVKDYGTGIPTEEQDLIFERFFRGKGKKDKVHGLGLGLSFSKMIARALGGDLNLKNSSPEGTIFTLLLSK